MTRKNKLLAAICSHLKAVQFEDACKVAERLGFTHTLGEGSHRVYKRSKEPTVLYPPCQAFVGLRQAKARG